MRILLVEDTTADAVLLEQRLADASHAEYRVARSERLADALVRVATEPFDIVLLDLGLPDSVGLETLHRMHERSEEVSVPIVVITGHSDEHLALDAVKAGAQDYLFKGEFESRMLVRTIQSAIERHRMLMELQEARQREHYLATHDALTGLPNRYLFADRLGQSLASARRYGQRVAILFLDLDRFKTINDTLGHSVGDQLLHAVARRLSACLRASDSAARIGGDEFVVLLPGIRQSVDAAKVARNVERALSRPYRMGHREFYITTSIGIALYPEDGENAEDLVKNADTAMYSAKDSGGDNCHFYSRQMNASSLKLLALENDLRRAIELDQLRLHFQPQIDGRTGTIVGAEALVRWLHPDLGLVSPVEFIPLAEETGLIGQIGEWVLLEACRQTRHWQDAGLEHAAVSVNVSPRQFWHTDFHGRVDWVLRETRLPPSSLTLEITESCLMRDVDSTVKCLGSIKDLGVAVSLDDFGTGYSSLSVLRRLPLDVLKMDRSFTREAIEDRDGSMVAAAIIGLANSLGLSVLAEGVETEAQREFLIEHACPGMQGFLFSPPLPAPDFGTLLNEGRIELPKPNPED
ncbi:MAG: EAL domain-containing protein [Proteobacteria bacterium]|nr:EAL domain-containing protein [Pseudomonadota bacterium]